jgi:glyoxylase-like metal-dependent hydrolase (beta-lactamase superfamily II)
MYCISVPAFAELPLTAAREKLIMTKSIALLLCFLSTAAAWAQSVNSPAAGTSIAIVQSAAMPTPAPVAPTNPASAQSATTPVYEVFAIRYASIPDFPVNALIAGADPARKLSIAMTIWVIRGNGRVILVDSGFYRPQFFKQFKVDGFLKPSDAVAQSGITPAIKAEDVTDVVITHMHWDHADGMDLFPNARIWLQKDEYTYYTGEAWQQPRTHGGIDPDDVLAAVKLNLAGRVRLVNGDAQEIFPGITCYTGGKHTFQSQYVGVNTRAGTVILASDNMYLYENLEKHAPIAQTLDAASNLRAQDRMKQLAASPRLIVPGHDPAVFEKFPKVSERAVRIE